MLALARKEFGKTLDFGKKFKDGRLTEASNSGKFDYRAAIKRMNELGRPLTEMEMKEFKL